MSSINLKAGEKILLVVHRHWIIIAWQIISTLILLMLPMLIVVFGSVFETYTDLTPLRPFLFFGTTIYWMIVVAGFFLSWIRYWLDVWIITTERVVAIDQIHLFNRKITEFSLSRVQDVTVSVPNILATFMHYGNITVQTAGEINFSIYDVMNCDKAKNIILQRGAETLKKDVGSVVPKK